MTSITMPTVCLTIDNLGAALKVGRGQTARPDPNEPGLRDGLPNALALLAELGLTATFFLEGWNALHHPHAIKQIADSGHEVGLHGWVHEAWAQLTEFDRERLLYDGTAAFELIGIRPRGFRAPGGYRGAGTEAMLAELGYDYDSSIDEATEHNPLAIRTLPGGLACIPWHWDANDFCQYLGHPRYCPQPSALPDVADRWNHHLCDIIAEPGLFTLTLHPFVTFVDDDRIRLVRDLLRRALDAGVTVLGAAQLLDRDRVAAPRSDKAISMLAQASSPK